MIRRADQPLGAGCYRTHRILLRLIHGRSSRSCFQIISLDTDTILTSEGQVPVYAAMECEAQTLELWVEKLGG